MTSVLRTGSRRKRVVYSGWLAVGVGLMGVPLVLAALWPGLDHSPYLADAVVLALGLCLSTLSYAFGRTAIAGVTERGPRPVAAPGKGPYLLAGVFLVAAVFALVAVAV